MTSELPYKGKFQHLRSLSLTQNREISAQAQSDVLLLAQIGHYGSEITVSQSDFPLLASQAHKCLRLGKATDRTSVRESRLALGKATSRTSVRDSRLPCCSRSVLLVAL
jgi:hypothetical protein